MEDAPGGDAGVMFPRRQVFTGQAQETESAMPLPPSLTALARGPLDG